MKMKQIFAMLLAFMLLLGGIPTEGMGSLLFPVIAQAAPDTKTGYIIDEATKTYSITGPEGWRALEGICNAHTGMTEWKVTLANDIVLASGQIPSVDDFKGSFDGQGHVMKISSGNNYFKSTTHLGGDVGLFRNLLGSAKVENLIVWLEGGTLKAADTIANADMNSYGALVGKMSNSSQLNNCALVGSGTVEYSRKVPLTDSGMELSVGSMVGQMDDTSKIDGCYSEVSVTAIRTADSVPPTTSTYNIPMAVGGIVGRLLAVDCTLSNLAYLGPKVEAQNYTDTTVFVGGIMGAAGTFGLANSITNCFVKGTHLYGKDSTNGSLISYGWFGYIGLGTDTKITNCYSNAVIHGGSNCVVGDVGKYSNIDGVNAAMMGATWADTMEGFPSLKWLVTPKPPLDKVTVTADSPNALTIAPPYVNYSGGTGYDSTKGDSLWKFDMEIPVKGRTAPMTNNLNLHKTSGNATITGVTVSDNSGTVSYYSGLDYPFLATITGSNVVGNLSLDKLTWAAFAKHDTGVAVDTSGWWKPGDKGTLSIPPEFYGTIDVTATYDGVVSPAIQLAVKRGALTLESKTVPPNSTVPSKVPMALTLNAAQGVLDAVQLAHVTWTLATGDAAKFTLDKSGVLTVGTTAADLDKATVTADVVGMEKATAIITVTAGTTQPTGTAATLTETKKDSPSKIKPLGMQGVDSGSTATDTYSVTLPTVPGMSYYYKFAKTTDVAGELAKVYTSTAMLADSTHSYIKYADGIKLPFSGTKFTDENLLVVAVDDNVGTKLPSSATQFILPPLPTGSETPLPCANPAAAGALAPAISKLTDSLYSANSTDPGSPLWSVILPTAVTPDGRHPQTTDYIATGDIKVTVYPAKDRFGQDVDAARGSRFVVATSSNGTKGEVAPKPTVYPRGNGIITGGVTISVPDGAKVFYTQTSNVIAPVKPEVDVTTGEPSNKTTKLYTAGDVIDFPAGAKSFVVCAVAWIKGKSLSDIDFVVYKNTENLLTPAAPTLLLGGIKYNMDSTYPGDSTLVFDHPELADGEVLFTVNGEEPVAGRNNTKIFVSSGATGPNSFDPTKPYPMNSTSEFVSVRAKFHDKKKGLDSPIADYLVSVKQNLSAPVASVESNTMVRPGASLELSLSDAAIVQLNTNSKIPVKRLAYQSAIDDKDTSFPGAKEVILAGDTPKAGVEYVSYQVDTSTQAYNLPVIRYRLGDDKTNLASNGTIYRYGQRRVLSTSKTVTGSDGVNKIETTVTITYTNPQPISLTGTAGQQLKVNTMAISGMEVRADSEVVTFNYTIRGAMAKPTAFPQTKPDKPTAINIGDRIALSSETSDALIFYTLDGSEPRVEYTPPTAPDTVGTWKALDVNTLLYNEAQSIKMESNAQLLFPVRAIAVSKNFSLENSPPTLFLYQPPAPVPAVFASPIQGAVVANQAIALRCSMEGAKIFYRTFTSRPDITSDAGKLANLPKPDKDQIFDPAVPILITKPTWIVAIAEKNGAMSEPTLNEYTVAPTLSEPTTSLKTGSVVHKGTRIHLTSNGSIAFTLDGSDPKAGMAAMQATPPPAAKDTPAVLFGDSLVIDGEYGKAVIVKAFTYGEGHTPSNVATFTYTICDKDSYISAVPPTGAVITSGTAVTLTTTVSDGLVFYSTGSSTPTLINRYDDDGRYNWESEDKKHDPYDAYQWRAGPGTRKGNSVQVEAAPGSTFTVKAIAVANGSDGGSTQVFTYTIRDQTAAPSASIPNGAVALEGATVTLSAQEGDIFYTVDGTEPTTSSRLYVEPIPITGSMVLKAIALAKDKTTSGVAEYHYSYADQAFPPSMSLPGGEIEQGSQITLTSQTPDASIYYTTNGADPTDKSILYTSPIAVMRPVTIKAIAIKKELRGSAVNSATYTVVEPQLPTTDETNGSGKPQTRLDSLVSRRTYFDETAGPKFSEVVIQDAATHAVLSANATAVPKRAKLIVKEIDSSDSDQEAVRAALGYHIVTLYDVSLEQDGEKIQPTGEVEIGIPIPGDYQNGMVAICRVGTDNTVEEYEPRRSGSNAYITVEGKLDRYAVVVPQLNQDSSKFSVWQILIISVLVTLIIGGIVLCLILLVKRRSQEDDEPISADTSHHLDD